MEQSLAEGLAEQLKIWDINTVYGVPGDDILPFLEALKKKNIAFIGASHEAGAAFMATYAARLTGKLTVCVVSAAGTVNLMEGLTEAALDRLPVLALTGQVAEPKIGLSVHQYYRQQLLFSTFTPHSEILSEKNAAQELLLMLVSRALIERNLAHLSIPENLWLKPVDWQMEPLPTILDTKEITSNGGDLAGAISVMKKSKKPLILLGHEAKNINAQIRELVRRWGAGIIVALDAKGKVPDHWPEVIGGIGQAWLPQGIAEADCILLIGAASYEKPLLPAVPVIQITKYFWEIEVKHLKTALIGDPAVILQDLIEGLKGYVSSASWQQLWQKDRREWEDYRQERLADTGFPWHPGTVMAYLDSIIVENAFIILDIGAFNRWFNSSFKGTKQEVFVSAQWRSMGAAIPGALAIQAIYPNRQVVAIVGDGGLAMSLGELSTAIKHQFPIKVIVVNNRGYGLEQDKAKSASLNPPGLSLPSIDYALVAQGFGIKGYSISEDLSLAEVLQGALADPGPVVIDLPCREAALPFMG